MLLGLFAVKVHYVSHDGKVKVEVSGALFHGLPSLLNEPVSLTVAVCKHKDHHALHELLLLGLSED